AGAHGDFALEAGLAEHGNEVVRGDDDPAGAALGDLHGRVTHRPADFPLQRANAGLAGVALDDQPQRLDLDLGLFRLEAVGLELAADQIAPRDFELFVLGVAGQADDLHAVLQ